MAAVHSIEARLGDPRPGPRPAAGRRLQDHPERMTPVWFARYAGAMSDPLAVAASGLSEQQAALLDFEKQWWALPGSKESEIRERFSISPTRYYQVLNALIDSEEALAHDPLLVKRLRRLRSSRQKERTARRLGVNLKV